MIEFHYSLFQLRILGLHKYFESKRKLTVLYLGPRIVGYSFFFFLTFSRVKFHGSVYKLVKEGKRNKTCNCPFSEEKRPIIEAEINMALKIS